MKLGKIIGFGVAGIGVIASVLAKLFLSMIFPGALIGWVVSVPLFFFGIGLAFFCFWMAGHVTANKELSLEDKLFLIAKANKGVVYIGEAARSLALPYSEVRIALDHMTARNDGEWSLDSDVDGVLHYKYSVPQIKYETTIYPNGVKETLVILPKRIQDQLTISGPIPSFNSEEDHVEEDIYDYKKEL